MMPGIFLLIAIGAVGIMFLLKGSAPSVGDTAEVNGVDFVFRQVGAGHGWAPVNATSASKFTDGMIVQIRGASWKWFPGLGAFVQV